MKTNIKEKIIIKLVNFISKIEIKLKKIKMRLNNYLLDQDKLSKIEINFYDLAKNKEKENVKRYIETCRDKEVELNIDEFRLIFHEKEYRPKSRTYCFYNVLDNNRWTCKDIKVK